RPMSFHQACLGDFRRVEPRKERREEAHARLLDTVKVLEEDLSYSSLLQIGPSGQLRLRPLHELPQVERVVRTRSEPRERSTTAHHPAIPQSSPELTDASPEVHGVLYVDHDHPIEALVFQRKVIERPVHEGQVGKLHVHPYAPRSDQKGSLASLPPGDLFEE